ncbi:MAG: glycosyltransferase family 4 protein [Thermacetogeniaceae bacterium]
MENRRNIWILNHYAISPDMAGGTRHYDLGRELVKRGYEVTIFASGFDHVTHKYVKVAPGEGLRVEDHNGVKFVWLETVPYQRNDWRRILNMLSYGFAVLRHHKNFEKPDVIIGSSMHPVAPLVGWWLARKYQARFIFEVRDLWPQTAVDMGAMRQDGLMARLLYAWEKLMYKKADKIIVLLPYAGDYIAGRGINPEKIVWIPNGVDLRRFDRVEPLDASSAVARVFEEQRNKFKVVYAGAHGPANGLDNLINAAALMAGADPDVHFFLVGDGPEKASLLRMAREMQVTNITFLDPVPKSKVAAVLRKADLLLFCLKSLGVYKYGISLNKLYDYLASCKPVIMSGSAANQVVEEAEAGLVVEPDNPEALVRAILQIKQMPPEERERLGANGRCYVERYHGIEVLGEKLSQVITEVLQN